MSDQSKRRKNRTSSRPNTPPLEQQLQTKLTMPFSNVKKPCLPQRHSGLPKATDDRFTHYIPKNGDVMIWDGPWGNKYVQHSGIAAEPYDILYAGSASRRAPHGWAHGQITDFTGSKQDYGSPTAVYRYKG